jgi:phytol kinase
MTTLSSLLPAAGTPAGEVGRAVLVVAALLLLFAVAEGWRHWSHPPAEWTRKFVHLSGGLVAASFPWVFGSPVTVLALGALFAAVLWGARRRRLLSSVHGIQRRSEGAIYYPVAVCLLFIIGRHQPVYYLIALFVLVISDTLAALLGSAYGRWTYAVEAGHRSLEGSAAFFLTTLLSVHLPLLLLTGIDRAASVLIGLQIALLVTSLEAISLRGNDNLIAPLATYYFLVKMTPYAAGWIGLQILAQLAILALIALLAWRSRLLSVSGVIAAHLFFYGALALGGPRWVVAPALALAGFMAVDGLARRRDGAPAAGYQVTPIFYVSVVAAALFLIDNTAHTLLGGPSWLTRGQPLYAPFVGALAAQLAILMLLRQEPRRRSGEPPPPRAALLAALAAFVIVVPLSVWTGPGEARAARLAVAGGVCGGGLALYYAGRCLARRPRDTTWDLRLQAVSIATVTVVALSLYLWWGD